MSTMIRHKTRKTSTIVDQLVLSLYLRRGQVSDQDLVKSNGTSKACQTYSHLFNKRGAWNKRGGGAKVAKLLNVELGINVEDGIFGKN